MQAAHILLVYTSIQLQSYRHALLPPQVYTWPSGAVYEGTVVCGRREGRGKLSFTRWPSVYEGDFRDGVRHGQGVLYTNLARTSYYRGAWRGAGEGRARSTLPIPVRLAAAGLGLHNSKRPGHAHGE